MSDPFSDAVARFDAAHLGDPDGRSPRYHAALVKWVDRLAPDASEALRLAAHCQHIERWRSPRSDYPEGLAGYRRWRSTLARLHADRAEGVLRDVGYGDETVGRVRALLTKRGLKVDPEVQLFEDAICLVFLEHDLADFAQKHNRDKVIRILRKTWNKMSASGHQAALDLAGALPEPLRSVVSEAVGESEACR